MGVLLPEAMDAACSWLLQSRKVWEEWVPDTTACFPQFGLFNEATDAWPSTAMPDVFLAFVIVKYFKRAQQ